MAASSRKLKKGEKLTNVMQKTGGSTNKLTNISSQTEKKGNSLTSQKSAPFILCFRDKLVNDFGFKNLKENNLKELHRFLDKAAGQSITSVEMQYKRQPDKTDEIMIQGTSYQIEHFEVSRKFRIHGFYDGNLFIVYRLDPNHKVHR